MTPEARIKKKLTDMLKSKKLVWYFSPNAGPFGKSGIPDIIVCVRGRLVGIECKSNPSKKLTPLQNKTGLNIQDAEGLFFVANNDESIKQIERAVDAIIGT